VRSKNFSLSKVRPLLLVKALSAQAMHWRKSFLITFADPAWQEWPRLAQANRTIAQG
jgi:hypothetical protein